MNKPARYQKPGEREKDTKRTGSATTVKLSKLHKQFKIMMHEQIYNTLAISDRRTGRDSYS